MAREEGDKTYPTAQKAEIVVYLDDEEVTTIELEPKEFGSGSTGFEWKGNFVDQESGDGFWNSFTMVLKGSKRKNR